MHSGARRLHRAYEIEHPLLKLRIYLLRIGELRLHEEIVPEILMELASRIAEEGVLRHPVIVDENTLIVLDGTHRVEALREIGCKYVVACLVDYNNPAITIGRWYRYVRDEVDVDRVLRMLSRRGFFTLFHSDLEEFRACMGKPDERIGVLAPETYVTCFRGRLSKKEVYDMVREVESELKEMGHEVLHGHEDKVWECFVRGEVNFVLVPPLVRKREVVETVMRYQVFAPKTTRHVIPARPLFVNVPLELLKGGVEIGAANEILARELARRGAKLIRGGVVEGRVYDEELYVFGCCGT